LWFGLPLRANASQASYLAVAGRRLGRLCFRTGWRQRVRAIEPTITAALLITVRRVAISISFFARSLQALRTIQVQLRLSF
jgi:hypothetical protein